MNAKGNRQFVIRCGRVRKVYAGHQIGQESELLADFAEELPELGRFTMEVQFQPGRSGSKKRTARTARETEFMIQAAPVLVCRPHVKRGIHSDDPLPLFVVRVCEVDPPSVA